MLVSMERRFKFISWPLGRYLLREILPSFLLGTTIFLLIMLMFQVIRLSEFVVVHQVPLWEVAKLSYFLIVTFFPLAIPIAFLFAVLMGISRCNSEGEILAMQANGIGLSQVFRPLLAFSTIVSLICLYFSMYTVPRGNRSFELLITKLGNERVMVQLKPGVFLDGFYGLVLFAEQLTPVRNEMKRVFIYDEREEKYPLFITAREGVLKRNPEGGVLTLRLNSGTIHIDKKTPKGVLQKIDFDLYDINLEIGEAGDSGREYSPPSYTYDHLVTRLNETIHDPPTHRQLTVEMHRRFSLSFSCVIFSALGFFIGILSQRGIRSSAVVLCLLVGVIYWLAYLASNALAISGTVAPWIGIWAPNLFFLIVARLCYMKYRST